MSAMRVRRRHPSVSTCGDRNAGAVKRAPFGRLAAPVVALSAVCVLYLGVASAAVSREPLSGVRLKPGDSSPIYALKLGGTAVQQQGGSVRLTEDMQRQMGYMFSEAPVSAIGQEWRIDVSVRISGKGITLFGDGMALWYTREPFRPPPKGATYAYAVAVH